MNSPRSLTHRVQYQITSSSITLYVRINHLMTKHPSLCTTHYYKTKTSRCLYLRYPLLLSRQSSPVYKWKAPQKSKEKEFSVSQFCYLWGMRLCDNRRATYQEKRFAVYLLSLHPQEQ